MLAWAFEGQPSFRGDLRVRETRSARHSGGQATAVRWLALVTIVALVSFGAGEAMVRLANPRILNDDNPIILGSPAMTADRNGAVHYLPRAVVRYAFSTTSGLEYDVRFQTNNLGYVDDRDYPLPAGARRTVAFVGDSYSVGAEGGEPWVPALRERTRATLYNLGTPATGFMHFERTLESFRQFAELPEIVIVATSDDFFRPLWRPLRVDNGLRMCLPETPDAECTRQLLFSVDLDESSAAVQRVAESVRQRVALPPRSARAILMRSALLRFVTRLPAPGSVLARWRLFQRNAAALREIRARFPAATIRMVHVPDKFESEAGRYTVDVAAMLGELHIDYFSVLERCPLAQDSYYARDNHPNAAGYRKLAACVSNYLGLGD